MIIRSFASAERQKNFLHFAVHLYKARSVTFCLVEDDQVAEEITLSHLESELLALTCPGAESERDHSC